MATHTSIFQNLALPTIAVYSRHVLYEQLPSSSAMRSSSSRRRLKFCQTWLHSRYASAHGSWPRSSCTFSATKAVGLHLVRTQPEHDNRIFEEGILSDHGFSRFRTFWHFTSGNIRTNTRTRKCRAYVCSSTSRKEMFVGISRCCKRGDGTKKINSVSVSSTGIIYLVLEGIQNRSLHYAL